jgi:murein biosynthesis integral membrane protein MurJ
MFKNFVRLLKENAIIKASLLLSVITCLVKIAGYLEKMLLAYYWGTGYEADAYNAVFALIISIFVFFREIVEPGFLNNFLKVRHNTGKKESWSVFFTVFWCLFPAGVIVSLCLFLFPEAVTRITLPGFENERFTLAARLLQMASPACIFLILSTLTYIALNAFKRFTIAATGDLAFKLVLVLCIVLFARRIGIYAAIYGLVVGATVKLAIHVTALWKDISWSNTGLKRTYLNSIWVLTWPLLIGIIFSQISNLVDNVFASYLQEGSLSALSYAKKIVELPVVIFPYALSIVLFPHLSQLHIEKNSSRIKDLLHTTFKWIAIIFIPLAVITFLFSENIIHLIFQRGAFDVASTLLTAKPLAIYSLGMPAFAVETVLVIAYFSLSDTKTPIFIGIICVIINIMITWILLQYTDYLGIAWGLVISKSLKVIILLYLLKNRFKRTEWKHE